MPRQLHRSMELASCVGRVLSTVLMLTMVIAGCSTLPPPQGRTETSALADTAGTHLGRNASALTSAHPGVSGIHKLPEPHDAFAARMLLAENAEKSLDAQYFIWNGDQVGYLLWEALWKAAERGVRVRLLLDDANTLGNDETISALDAHPNIEVRLYNPFTQRASRGLAYLTDFGRLNRRMHNKSFTADNQMAVVGGRNIANEYFGAGEGIGFADLDVVVIGPVVKEVSREFDLYWNSASSYPADGFVGPGAADASRQLRERFAQTRTDPLAAAYLDAVRQAKLIDSLRDRSLQIEWASASVIHDNPAKTLDKQERTDVLLLPELMKALGRPEKSLDIVSPYFVPGDGGTAALSEIARRGVRVRILTNSLAASDESVVHAGYMKRRRDLLDAGVELWELKPSATGESLEVRGRFGAAKVAGLHAKTYAVDRRRIFVGSFNFDQRSAKLNTEMGTVIDSARFAEDLGRTLDNDVRELAYRVVLGPDGRSLQWIERTPSGQERRYDVDPETTFSKRLGVGLLSNLPIDWLL